MSVIGTRWPPFTQYVGYWKKKCAIENNIHYGNKMAALITQCLSFEQDVYRWIKMPRPSNKTVAIGNSVHNWEQDGRPWGGGDRHPVIDPQ
jgi:hypothetical protein